MEGVEQTTATSDGRSKADRRRFTWRTVIYAFLRSRRRASRRNSDGLPVFVDWLDPWVFRLAVATMVMSALDAFLTLRLLSLGAVELNPVMAALIDQGTAKFVASKLLLTAFGIMALVFMARAMLFDRMRIGFLLVVFFCFYASLVSFELLSLLSLL